MNKVSEEEAERRRMNPPHRSLRRVSLQSNGLAGPVGMLSVRLKLRLEHLTLGSNQLTGNLDGTMLRLLPI